jgi:hypothetical protein
MPRAPKPATTADLEQELQRRRKRREFSLAAVCGRHMKQLAFALCRAPFVIALCSKRAGKTTAVMAMLADNAMSTTGTTNLYLGLTEKAIKYGVIPKLWNRLVRDYALPFTELNADLVATCTTTGSIVRFASVDDSAHIATFMGDELACGLVIIDECQALPLRVLQPLVEEVLMPSLSSTSERHPNPGRLVLIGTVPEVAAGYFFHKYDEAIKAIAAGQAPGFTPFNWNRFDNPFLTNQQAALDRQLKALNIPVTHPLIRRTFFGDVVFDANDTSYHYESARSTYVPISVERLDIGPFHCLFAPLPPGCDRLIVGIDPAQKKDRFAITIFAYDSKRRNQLFQVGEAVTDPGADPLESQWLDALKFVKARYGFVHKVVRDPGSSTATNDLLQHSHGILVESAIKGPGSLKARVDFLADLLARNVCKVILGSELDKDLQIARWDTDALERGTWKFSKVVCSPDVSDSASYIVPYFTDLHAKGPAEKHGTEEEFIAAQMRRYQESLFAPERRRAGKPRRPSVAGNLHAGPIADRLRAVLAGSATR